ncbi:hypothetical protein EVAR_20385_1 [Eumeta japonica]|uniref:Uncharacterized protein n=1 Tax=Eumeta variegata TaxID=151549 RepID=A0A4C1TXT2_EUMVA|nr:hypothetical protein EVAR_20385_1 [Eumeta japonica]
MSRRPSIRDLEQKLKAAFLELKASREMCDCLVGRRDDHETEIRISKSDHCSKHKLYRKSSKHKLYRKSSNTSSGKSSKYKLYRKNSKHNLYRKSSKHKLYRKSSKHKLYRKSSKYKLYRKSCKIIELGRINYNNSWI